ncbi:MAG: oxaloacetate decarboxylase beta subunit, partial [Saprospiraceae bacterium]
MEIFNNLYTMTAFDNLIESPGALLMLAIAVLLLYLGIKKGYEPLLLVPIGFGVLLANFPTGNMAATDTGGIMYLLYGALIKTTILPPLIFMGVGAMTDFGPMLRNLRLAFFGAAAQLGIFIVLISAVALGFTPQEAAALGIIGGADGPTAIFIAIELAPHLLGPIAIAAYSYMALIPVILPLVSKTFITEKEFKINMRQQDKLYPNKTKIKDLKTVKIIFPIALAIVVCLVVPTAAPLVGMLLFGNL